MAATAVGLSGNAPSTVKAVDVEAGDVGCGTVLVAGWRRSESFNVAGSSVEVVDGATVLDGATVDVVVVVDGATVDVVVVDGAAVDVVVVVVAWGRTELPYSPYTDTPYGPVIPQQSPNRMYTFS